MKLRQADIASRLSDRGHDPEAGLAAGADTLLLRDGGCARASANLVSGGGPRRTCFAFSPEERGRLILACSSRPLGNVEIETADGDARRRAHDDPHLQDEGPLRAHRPRPPGDPLLHPAGAAAERRPGATWRGTARNTSSAAESSACSRRFLPLKAIKAILDDQASSFSSTQRTFLLGVKQHLRPARRGQQRGPVDGSPSASARAAICRLHRARADRRPDRRAGERVIAQDDGSSRGWRCSARVREGPRLRSTISSYDEIVTQLFQREAQLLVAAARSTGAPRR